MKAKIFNLIIGCLLLSGTATAQHFWVIETNPQVNATHFRIYDERSRLVHEEKIEGWRLDVRLRSDRKYLNRKLKQVTRQQALAATRRTSKERRGKLF